MGLDGAGVGVHDCPTGREQAVTLLEVGRVTRAHGLKGEVVVELVTDRIERVASGSVLTLGGPGISRTLEVRSATRSRRPSGSGRAVRGRWIVQFAEVSDREGAEALRSRALLAPPLDDAGALWVHQLIGAEVLDIHGNSLGMVSAVEANPASDLLVLEGGRLVPMCFMTEGPSSTRIVVDIPSGLLE
ncbi:MAG: ribosome maturation factor RimM [Acidimicrobiales bacterium]